LASAVPAMARVEAAKTSITARLEIRITGQTPWQQFNPADLAEPPRGGKRRIDERFDPPA